MQVMSVVAAVYFVLTGMLAPANARAQEAPGHILFTVRICLVDMGPAVTATFDDVPCDAPGSSSYDSYMVVSLDNGTFTNGVSSFEIPVASLYDANLYLVPGDYTLTISSEQRTGTLVSSIDLNVVSGETIPLTYTIMYAAQVGAEPPLPPVENVPETPVAQPATPALMPEIPVDDGSVPTDPDPTMAFEPASTTIPEAPASSHDVTALPNTGTGPADHRGVLLLMAAALGSVVGATAVRMRRA
jgi:hypothetical protein